MSRVRTSRRRFLKLVAGGSVASRALVATPLANVVCAANAIATPAAAIGDAALLLEFDSTLRSRAWHLRPVRQKAQSQVPLTAWAYTECLLLEDGSRVEQFALRQKAHESVDGPQGLCSTTSGACRMAPTAVSFTTSASTSPRRKWSRSPDGCTTLSTRRAGVDRLKLRGRAPRRYRLRDYFNDRDLGEVASPGALVQLAFERFLVLEAIPA